MTSPLSDAEFERFQNQLLELKTKNYTLEEKCKKHALENLTYKEKCDFLEKELGKYQNLAKLNPLSFAKSFQLNKSQKEKELIDSLIEEKDFFQKKLQTQEDEFKLTNSMLRQEIINLLSEIKKLKNKQKDETDSQESSEKNEEIIMQLNPNTKNKISYAILSEKEQLENSLDESNQSLVVIKEENDLLKNDLFLKNKELEENKFKFDSLKNQNSKLEQFIEKLQTRNNTVLSEINSYKEQIETLQKKTIENQELAEKRLSTINELKCHIEDINTNSNLNLENTNKKYTEIKNSLSKELNLAKAEKKNLLIKNEDLQKQLKNFNEIKTQNTKLLEKNEDLNKINNNFKESLKNYEEDKLVIKNLKEEKESLIKKYEEEKESLIKKYEEERESLITKYEEERESLIKKYEEERENLIKKYEEEKENLNKEFEEKIDLKTKELISNVESLKDEIISKDNLIKKLRQDLEDQIEERKIHDKKGVMYVKELKKQLYNEKKIKERLQERFGELHSEKSFELGNKNFDTTSVGSWSFLSSNKDVQNINGKNNSSFSIHSSTDGKEIFSNGVNSPINENYNNYSQNQVLEKENTQLVSRITQLQQEKWTLEEKYNQMLLSNEKLENEIEDKQKIISYYCMERRAEPKSSQSNNEKFTVKKVVDFIKDKGDDNLKEINRKLQRMLEETLTKNMYLQTNLETLSNELHSRNNS